MESIQILNYIITVILILLVYYAAVSVRKREEAKVKKIQNELKVSDKVITYSGLTGEIIEVFEDRIIIKTNPSNILLSIEKWAVAGIDDRNI